MRTKIRMSSNSSLKKIPCTFISSNGDSRWLGRVLGSSMILKVMALVKNMTICNPSIHLQCKSQYIKLHAYNGDVNFAHFFLHNIHSSVVKDGAGGSVCVWPVVHNLSRGAMICLCVFVVGDISK